jgi:molecular chaperone DnaK (HSP70)
MDKRSIERLNAPGFSIARRGYNQREVDNFLGDLSDWLTSDAAQEIGQLAVKHKLELVGKSTAQILLKTEEEAERLKLRTEEECAELQAEAEHAAREVRNAAEEYAKKTRDRTNEETRRTVEAAKALAKNTVEQAERRRAQVEGVIAELGSRRDEALRQLEALHEALGGAIAKQRDPRPAPNGGKQRAKAAKDPAPA